MSLELPDFRTFATVAIFVATYAGVALGRVPGLRIDRAGISLVGASLMIAFGTLSLEEAFKAVDLDAIALLLGMMIIVAQLRVSGFFELATGFAIRRAHGPLVLLTAIVIVTGFFSAFLVNDAICLVIARLVIEVTCALRRIPLPYGVMSHLPYAEFFARLAPAAAVALADLAWSQLS